MKRPNKKETSKPAEIRLNRFVANAGVCSRREADNLIAAGKIKVNGKVVSEMGYKVKKTDTVEYKGKKLKSETHQYVLLNKPRGFVTTTKDPHAKRTVMELVEKACEERIYPVGRLDKETTGLLLFTNDGETAKKLTHPSHKVKKIYQVELDKPITKADFDSILKGIELDDGPAVVNEMAVLGEDSKVLGVEIHIGRNRIVRRIFEHLGYEVKKLDRVMFASLTKKNLPRGKYRHLSPKEVMGLKGIK
ncbi:23S rRNA pseudouridine2605 synthase [Ekhidna lutea]|uniref:Pseudouridine synthase n=1 Tax=Ekhidna lutea TaxID=447679 RepID=A0A239FFE5_EKHLU|nr:pseudouridine synthase [Ekhidna lutea]SNS54804.1 23S rRNA pseudouridine2605 synthase [Ekhidna lutea]